LSKSKVRGVSGKEKNSSRTKPEEKGERNWGKPSNHQVRRGGGEKKTLIKGTKSRRGGTSISGGREKCVTQQQGRKEGKKKTGRYGEKCLGFKARSLGGKGKKKICFFTVVRGEDADT